MISKLNRHFLRVLNYQIELKGNTAQSRKKMNIKRYINITFYNLKMSKQTHAMTT